jgi:hypothetical protein
MNFTTSIDPNKTCAECQRMLAKAGASQIMVEFNGTGDPVALAFSIQTVHGPRQFQLPANAEAVSRVLVRQKVAARYRTPEQAHRVSWRILKDWLAAQLAILETEMVLLDQIFLPFMLDPNGVSVYELYADNQLALGRGTE